MNNDAYAVNKTLEVFWAGGKYALTPSLEFTLAYYGYHQDAYATGAESGCSSIISSKCSGNLNAVSGLVDYRFTKRFDVYLGSMWSGVTRRTRQRLHLQPRHRHHHRRSALQVLSPGTDVTVQGGTGKRARASGPVYVGGRRINPLLCGASAEATGNVVLGEAVARVGEYAVGIPDLDEFT